MKRAKMNVQKKTNRRSFLVLPNGIISCRVTLAFHWIYSDPKKINIIHAAVYNSISNWIKQYCGEWERDHSTPNDSWRDIFDFTSLRFDCLNDLWSGVEISTTSRGEQQQQKQSTKTTIPLLSDSNNMTVGCFSCCWWYAWIRTTTPYISPFNVIHFDIE